MRPSRRQLLQAGGLTAAALLVPSTARAGTMGPQSSDMLFGVCGHPYNSAAYNANSSTTPGVPYSVQVDMLTQLGAQVYRNNIFTNDLGHSTNHQKLLDMQSLLDAAGIMQLPMLQDNYSASISEQANYDRGFDKGQGFAAEYGHMFSHYHLGNEWELFKDLKDDIGHVQSHYDLAKTARAMKWIQGANDGIKDVQETAKTAVPMAGWFPTWWQQYLLDNVDLDFVDWHWYADQQGNIDALPSELNVTNILDFLWAEYGLPIWISESNSRSRDGNSDALNEQRQVDWFDEWYAMCLAHPHCEAMFVYELLNEPMLDKAYEELNFGLVKFPNFDPANPDHTDWEWKQLGRQLIGLDQLIGHFGSDSEGWALGLGPEFPGAQGTFVRDNSEAISGDWSGVLTGDFSGGGSYVQISRPIDLDLSDLRFWARSNSLNQITLRMTDSTGQVHQQRLPLTSDLSWQALHVSTFDGGLGYSHWAGANDGVWHGPASRIALVLGEAWLEPGLTGGAVRFDGVTATVP